MTATIGTSTNTNNVAVIDEITVNNATSVKILDAVPAGQPPHIKVVVTNQNANDLWVKFQAASVDNDKKGILITQKKSVTIMEGSDIYIGEVSAIYAGGGPDTVCITRF